MPANRPYTSNHVPLDTAAGAMIHRPPQTAGWLPSILSRHNLLIGAVILSAVLVWRGGLYFLGERIFIPLVAVLTVVMLVILIVARARQEAATLLAVSLPLVAFGVIEAGWSIRPTQLVVLAILFVWLLGARVDIRRIPLRGWLLLYLLSLAFSTWWAIWHPAEITSVMPETMAQRASAIRPLVQLFTATLALAVFPVVTLAVDSETRLSRTVRGLLAITALVCLYGLYQSFAVSLSLPLSDITWGIGIGNSAITNYGETRHYAGVVTSFAPRATFAESLHFGAYLAGIFPLCLACWLGRTSLPERWRHWPWRTLSLLLGLVLLLTFSRSSWFAAAVAAFIVVLLSRRFRTWIVFAAGVGVAYAVFSLLAHLPIFESSLSTVGLITGRLSPEYLLADPRVIYIQILYETALSSPIWGIGLGNYAIAGASALGLNVLLSAHSVWAAHWVEGGVIGLAVVLGLFAAIARRLAVGLHRLRRNEWYFPLLGMTAGVAAMSVQYFTWGDRFDPYFWFVIALAFAVINVATKPRAETPL